MRGGRGGGVGGVVGGSAVANLHAEIVALDNREVGGSGGRPPYEGGEASSPTLDKYRELISRVPSHIPSPPLGRQRQISGGR